MFMLAKYSGNAADMSNAVIEAARPLCSYIETKQNYKRQAARPLCNGGAARPLQRQSRFASY